MGKIALVFAGQGAQYTGMGIDMARCSHAAKHIFDIAECVRPGIAGLCEKGSKEELSLTVNTQPAVFAVDLACAEALRAAGIEADMTAGFSLGELAACVYAGYFTPEDGMKVIAERASLMDACTKAHPGSMTAVLKLSDADVISLALRYENVWAVNFNCPGQVAAAGSPGQLDDFCSDVAECGGRTVKLPVSGAFHCPFMTDATAGLTRVLNDITPLRPSIPVYGNYKAMPYENIAYELAMQASNPVRWSETVARMYSEGAETFIEVGPGKTLSGLIKRIAPSANIYNVSAPEELENLIKILR